MKRFIVRINMRNGSHKYVRVGTEKFASMWTVHSRKHATRTDTAGLAGLVSQHFWENHWDNDTMHSREVIAILIRSEK